MRRSIRLAIASFALLALTACNKGEGDTKSDPAPATKSATAPASKAPATKAEAPKGANPALLDPSKATEQAPATFAVKFETTKGDIIIDVTRAWSPTGADRFYNLVKIGYYDDVAFFRVIGGFMAQIGLHGDPKVNAAWRPARIKDDPVQGSNTRGMVTFAKTGMPNSRTTQIFFNFKNNGNLDRMGFAPIGKVRDMKIVDALHNGYGEGAPRGQGPSQGRIQSEGNTYLKAEFPKLDYIKKGSILAK
jgi:peptidyl-prolyl cis-trans isomerase A (cyclophilin A)